MVVCHLAPLCDQGKIAMLEGLMPARGRSAFKMPVQVFVYGTEEDRAFVEGRLARAGLVLITEAEALRRALQARLATLERESVEWSPRSPARPNQASPAHIQRMSREQVQGALDRLFDRVLAEQGANMPQCVPDPEVRIGYDRPWDVPRARRLLLRACFLLRPPRAARSSVRQLMPGPPVP